MHGAEGPGSWSSRSLERGKVWRSNRQMYKNFKKSMDFFGALCHTIANSRGGAHTAR